MKIKLQCLGCAVLYVFTSTSLDAAIRYVNVANLTPLAPFTNWATAAKVIQDAVDVALPGDEVVVTNGVYDTGRQVLANGLVTNRVAVTKPVLLRSVNGPEATMIRGEQSMNGWGVRCVYLTNGAALIGFTLTNGGGVNLRPFPEFDGIGVGGGVWCESSQVAISNCFISGNTHRGAYRGTLNNCTLVGNRDGGSLDSTLISCLIVSNSASAGGGAHGGTLSNCTLVANTAYYGGGAASAVLVDCLITNNFATNGGGAWSCDLRRCDLVANQATVGGGIWGNPCEGDPGPLGCPPPATCYGEGDCGLAPGVSKGCRIVGNIASVGGGAYGGWLYDCTLTDNIAQRDGSGLGGNGGGVASASLYGGIIRNNRAETAGGAFASILHNCLLTANSALEGGAAFGGRLANCILSGNSAWWGGGAYGGTLDNCTIIRNTASQRGGGVLSCSWGASPPVCTEVAHINNSVIYDNTAPEDPNHFGFTGSGSNFVGGSISYSCTTPLPTNSVGNITNAPLFVDAASGNFRLQSNSPSINAGRNANAPAGPDLDGNPRIVAGSVDIGAYEFQTPQSTLSYAWLQQYDLPADGSADFTDPDGDGHNNWQEWRAWTDPTNSMSALRLLPPLVNTNGVFVRWQSVNGRGYRLERKSDLGQGSFETVATNIVGQSGVTIYADTNAPASRSLFYRVSVDE